MSGSVARDKLRFVVLLRDDKKKENMEKGRRYRSFFHFPPINYVLNGNASLHFNRLLYQLIAVQT